MSNIFITGAGAGIGRATAQLFHRNGWQVGVTDVDQAALKTLEQELGAERLWCATLDVTNAAQVDKVLSAFAAAHGDCIDVLFNCAGILRTGNFADIPLAAHQQIFAINISGLVNVTYAAFKWLKRSDDARVINMSSASALYGVPDFASYSASKFAVRGLTEALNVEWSREGIKVVDLMPPFVKTAMVAANPSPLIERMGVTLGAEDIAAEAWLAATADDAMVHRPVGWQFRAAMWANKLLPARVTREMLLFLSR